jgi:putative ABC transport system ATP-binding protein
VLKIPRLAVASGERLVVLGPSGSGKSTLLDILAFLVRPDSVGRFSFAVGGSTHNIGSVWRTTPARLAALRARHIGYVLQTGGLLPYLSVRENVLLPRRLLGQSGLGPLDALAGTLGIGELLGRYPAQLSVGQRQRVAVVRALAHEPALVLADEPTAALEAGLALAVADALVDASSAVNAALVMVTHDEAVADRIGGRKVACCPDPAAASAELQA